MMSSRRDHPAAGRWPSAATGQSSGRAADGDIAALGESVADRLFTAGLELHFALMLLGDGPAARRCAMALDELDRAIKQVRQLALSAHEQPGDGQRDAGGASPGMAGPGLRADGSRRRQRICRSCPDRGVHDQDGIRRRRGPPWGALGGREHRSSRPPGRGRAGSRRAGAAGHLSCRKRCLARCLPGPHPVRLRL